jgi:anti-anti-sigma factor
VFLLRLVAEYRNALPREGFDFDRKDARQEIAHALANYGKETSPVEHGLKYTVRQEGSAVLLTLQGEMDLDASRAVYANLSDAFRNPECKDLVADMSELTFLDSSGITVFINVMQLLQGRGGALYMTRVHPSIRRAQTVTRLDRVFRICNTVAEVQTVRRMTPSPQNS